MIKKLLHILLFLAFPFFLNAQEVLTGLYTNAQIGDASKMHRSHKSADMLWIPFVDDFSSPSIFPNDTLWTDRNVFINSSYPYFPPTIGVATFDALNDTGALYTEASSNQFSADTLTSNEIRLDSFKVGSNFFAVKRSDSLYFSFLYQPGGNGNAPESEDSLALEFFSPADSTWYHVWSTEGSTLAQFRSRYNVWFKQVMIPITDSTAYFHKGFRFRFHNYVTLANNSLPSWAGNVDQWNIDYVYLNKGRNMGDSIYKDIAFVEPAPSALKNYYSMPWQQFCADPSGEMADTLYMTISDLDTVIYNSSYKYDIYDAVGSDIYSYSGGSYNILPYPLTGLYQDYHPHARPPLDYVFPCDSQDSATFRFVHVIKEGILGDSHRQNDTVIFDQKFYDYYAYDDGTAEAGYGLTPANSMLAYQFTLNQPDTLRAVKMFFNQTLNNASQHYFHLTVWDDAPGYPDNIIFQQTGIKPQYADSLNTFHSYRIPDTVNLVLSGTFYVGWVQTTDDNLNLGFDKNTDKHDKIFYNTGSGWANSLYPGALMIRPVFGKKLPVVASTNETVQEKNDLIVFPNPVRNSGINIILSSSMQNDAASCSISICDMFGRTVYAAPYSQHIALPEISDGIYIVGVTSSKLQKSCYSRISVIK